MRSDESLKALARLGQETLRDTYEVEQDSWHEH